MDATVAIYCHVHGDQRIGANPATLKATRLKVLCRVGALPVIRRAGREQEPPWPRATRTCPTCKNGEVEDVECFLMRCPDYESPRRSFMADVRMVIRFIDRSPIALARRCHF
jgi:hypothetical protein